MGQGLGTWRRSLRRLGKTCLCHAVHGAERSDDVVSLDIVVHRRRHKIEKLSRHFRMPDMKAEGTTRALDGERSRSAARADGDNKTRPRRLERLVRLN